MTKKNINTKYFKFSSVILLNSFNTYCSDDSIKLKIGSFIQVNDSKRFIRFELKKPTDNIEKIEQLLKYVVETFSSIVYENTDGGSDDENGKTLDEIFGLTKFYNNGNLQIVELNGYDLNDCNIAEVIKEIFTKGELEIKLIAGHVNVDYYGSRKIKDDLLNYFFNNVLNEIKVSYSIKQIKNILKNFFGEESVLKIYYEDGTGNYYEYKDNTYLRNNILYLFTNNLDCLTSKTAEIELKAGKEFFLVNNIEKFQINFVDDKIEQETQISTFIKDKYHQLSIDDNCVIEYQNDKGEWGKVENYHVFDDNDRIRVTINKEISDIIEKKDPNKLYINVNIEFDVRDNNVLRLKDEIENLENVEIESEKCYNDLLNIIKRYLGNKNLKDGFEIYKQTEDVFYKLEDKDTLEDGATYIVYFADDDSNFVEKISEEEAEENAEEKAEENAEEKAEENAEEKAEENAEEENTVGKLRGKKTKGIGNPTEGNPTDEESTDGKLIDGESTDRESTGRESTDKEPKKGRGYSNYGEKK